MSKQPTLCAWCVHICVPIRKRFGSGKKYGDILTPVEPCEGLGLPVVDRIPPTLGGPSAPGSVLLVGGGHERKITGMTGSLTAPNAAYHRVTPRLFAKDKLAREIKSYLIEAGDRPINVTDLCGAIQDPSAHAALRLHRCGRHAADHLFAPQATRRCPCCTVEVSARR